MKIIVRSKYLSNAFEVSNVLPHKIVTFLQLSLDSFTASASNSKPWMHGNIKSPPNGKSSLRNIPISKFPQPLAQIPASSLRSSTISQWLYPVWNSVGFFK